MAGFFFCQNVLVVAGTNWGAGLTEAVTSFFFPPKCGFCMVLGEPPVCAACASEFEPRPAGALHLPATPLLTWVDCCYLYDGRAAQAVKRLKYERATSLYQWMAARVLERFEEAGASQHFDIVTPVPLARYRLSHRGFNQSALLASALPNFEPKALTRVIETAPQVGSKRHERLLNLKDAFQAQGVNGKRVLMVDDVYTTGATAIACATALKQAGAVSVGCLCFCYDPLPGLSDQS